MQGSDRVFPGSLNPEVRLLRKTCRYFDEQVFATLEQVCHYFVDFFRIKVAELQLFLGLIK
jgi:hypothetical protein